MSSNETDIGWRIGDHEASALVSDTPVLTRGDTVSLRFLFRDLQGEYDAVRERLEYTDSVVKRGVAHNGVPWIRERLPARASVDSQIVLVEPGADVVDVGAFWAAVVGGSTDNRPKRAGGDRWITLELFVLANAEEYFSRYGEGYGASYGANRQASREALLDDLGGEVV